MSLKVTAPQEVLLSAIYLQLVKLPTCIGEETNPDVPLPNWPYCPYPHVHNVPSALIADDDVLPADTCFQLVKLPIWIGLENPVEFPLPN
jgi:hypothetical protein